MYFSPLFGYLVSNNCWITGSAYGNLAVISIYPLNCTGSAFYQKPIRIALSEENKAHLRDLIAATGQVILLKSDWNCQFFSLCDLIIWWMTSKNYRAPLLHYIKLCVSSQTPPWNQTGVTVRKRSIRVKIGDFLSRVTLKFDGWPWKTIGYLFYATLSFVHHFVAIGKSNWSYSPETPNVGHIRRLLEPCDLEICRMSLKNNRKPLLTYFKLCASFRSHW